MVRILGRQEDYEVPVETRYERLIDKIHEKIKYYEDFDDIDIAVANTLEELKSLLDEQ